MRIGIIILSIVALSRLGCDKNPVDTDRGRHPLLYLTVESPEGEPVHDAGFNYIFYTGQNLVTRNAWIRYSLPVADTMTIMITNYRGDTVAVPTDRQPQPAGNHWIDFDGSALPNGIYNYHFRSNSVTEVGSFFILTDDLSVIRQTQPLASTNLYGKLEFNPASLGIGKHFVWSSPGSDVGVTIADSITIIVQKSRFQEYVRTIKVDTLAATDVLVRLSE